jgi:ABC-type transport system involved in multi-copper enzyme maturation permease subunit
MKRALLVALREVKTYLQDKADMAFSLLLPIVTFALIYGAFGGTGLFHGTAYVVNEDPNGIYSQQLVDAIKKQNNLDLKLITSADAASGFNRSDLTMVFFIPADFSAKLTAGQPVEINIEQRGNGGSEGQIVASIIRGIVSGINQQFTVVDQVNQSLVGKNIAAAQITFTTMQFLAWEDKYPLIGIDEVSVGSQPNTVKEFLPGIITMYVLFSISLTAAAINDERKRGTLERLITTRLNISELFFGKFLAGVFRGFIQTLILLLLSAAVFHIFTPLSFLGCLLIALIFATACSAVGLLITSIARTGESSTWVGVFFTMTMVMLGGTFFTIEKGTALYTFSKLSINGYANDAVKTLINGGNFSTLGVDVSVLVGVSIIVFIISRMLFKAVPQGK